MMNTKMIYHVSVAVVAYHKLITQRAPTILAALANGSVAACNVCYGLTKLYMFYRSTVTFMLIFYNQMSFAV